MIVIPAFQDGLWGWLGVGVSQRYPPSPHYWAVSHGDLIPSESLPLASLSAFLNALRFMVDPYEQPQDLGGALGRVRDTIQNHIHLPDPIKAGSDSSTVTSYSVSLRGFAPASCLYIWNLVSHREDSLRM